MILTEAFRVFAATPTNIRWSTIAVCPDGTLAAAIWDDELKPLQPRTLSHVSRVSEWGGTGDAAGDHEWFRLLPGALAEGTPIRLIVARRDPKDRSKALDFTPRPELVGRVTQWDGEHLRIDFTKAATDPAGISPAVRAAAGHAVRLAAGHAVRAAGADREPKP